MNKDISTATDYLIHKKLYKVPPHEESFKDDFQRERYFLNVLDHLSQDEIPDILHAFRELHNGDSKLKVVIEELEQGLEKSDETCWRNTRLTLLSLCYSTIDDYVGLRRSCQQILAEATSIRDTVLVAMLLYELGLRLQSFQILKDAFSIISLSNVVDPVLSNKPMVMIGEELLRLHIHYQSSHEYRLFMEYVCRILSCNEGGSKYVNGFCSLHSQNVRDNIRDEILDDNNFLDDLECTSSFSSNFDWELPRFLAGEGDKHLYRVLNSVYCERNATALIRANQQAHLYNAANERSFKWDTNEEFILLCNCLHNYHKFLSQKVTNYSFKANSIILPFSKVFNVSSYISMTERFISKYELVRSPEIFPEFSRTFFNILLTNYKNNLFKISKINQDVKEQQISDPELRTLTRPDRKLVRQEKNEVANIISLALIEASKKRYSPLENGNAIYPKIPKNSNPIKTNSLFLRINDEEALARFLKLEENNEEKPVDSRLTQKELIAIFGLSGGKCEFTHVNDPYNMTDSKEDDNEDAQDSEDFDDLDYDSDDLKMFGNVFNI